MPTRNVNLTDRDDEFVDEMVTSGRFSNASEVIRAGLRLLDHQASEDAEKLAILRSLASEAFDELDQGQGSPIADEPGLADFIGRIGRRAAEQLDHPVAEC